MVFPLSLQELANIVIMTLAVAFIFRRAFHLDRELPFWKGMGYAALLVAPGIVLHEFGHKFVALAFGQSATFEIAIPWLAVGIILVLVNAPVVFFVPAFIAVTGDATPLQHTLISFAGPALNGLIYLLAWVMARRDQSRKAHTFWTYTRKINGFLFLFNMIPFPPFDGYGVFSNILRMFGV
ncbi:MAG: hypothetical protein AABY13_03930 [Nanoarchaeota archaeon]